MEIVYDDDDAARLHRPGHRRSARSTRCWSTGSSTTPSRSTSTRSATATELYLGGVMEHIEEAGIHSGDSACALPPITLGARRHRRRSARSTEAIARGVGVRGLLNVQYALQGRRALRARGQPAGVAHGAVRVQGDRGAAGQGGGPDHARRDASPSCAPRGCCRRTGDGGDAAAPTRRSRSRRRCCRSTGSAPPDGKGVDTVLGPEMKSTGEVMGIDAAFGTAFAKSQAAAYGSLPTRGPGVRVGGQPRQAAMIFPVKRLADLGLRDPGHRGHRRGAAPQRGRRARSCASTSRAGPGETDRRADPRRRGRPGHQHPVRRRPAARASTATRSAPPRWPPDIPCITTVQGAAAAVQGIEALQRGRDRRAVAAGAARGAEGVRAMTRPQALEDRRERHLTTAAGVVECQSTRSSAGAPR